MATSRSNVHVDLDSEDRDKLNKLEDSKKHGDELIDALGCVMVKADSAVWSISGSKSKSAFLPLFSFMFKEINFSPMQVSTRRWVVVQTMTHEFKRYTRIDTTMITVPMTQASARHVAHRLRSICDNIDATLKRLDHRNRLADIARSNADFAADAADYDGDLERSYFAYGKNVADTVRERISDPNMADIEAALNLYDARFHDLTGKDPKAWKERRLHERLKREAETKSASTA